VKVRERMAEHFKTLLNQDESASEDIDTYLQNICYVEEESLGKEFEYIEMLQAWRTAKRQRSGTNIAYRQSAGEDDKRQSARVRGKDWFPT
jgi:hypothetical protein